MDFSRTGELAQSPYPPYSGILSWGLDWNYEQVPIWRSLAEEGFLPAQFLLADCYFYEDGGLEKDYNETVRLCTLGAQQNFAHAQDLLGLCYEFGRGVERTIEKLLAGTLLLLTKAFARPNSIWAGAICMEKVLKRT